LAAASAQESCRFSGFFPSKLRIEACAESGGNTAAGSLSESDSVVAPAVADRLASEPTTLLRVIKKAQMRPAAGYVRSDPAEPPLHRIGDGL